MELARDSKKPHAVCIPFPAQGHINPMMKLAKLLHHKGFHITFVNTHYNHNRLLRARGPDSLAGLPSFRFEAIPDGLPPTDNTDGTQDISALCRSTEVHCAGPLRELLHRLNDDAASSGGPPVSCIVSDVIMFFTLDVAEEFGVPNAMLWTAGAGALLGYSLFGNLLDMGIIPFKDTNFMTNGELDKVLDWVPEAKGIRLRDIPTFIRTTNPNEFIISFALRMMHNIKRASAILLNSFNALEHEAIQSLSSKIPANWYAIGPLQLFLDNIEDKQTKSIGSNLWKEDSRCLNWLDSQKPCFVVYVNFGSITVMTNDQLIEFAWGLVNSNQTFLWITRPDLVIGDSAVLPPEFMEAIKGRGLIASWCDQERVLAHPVIGGFLTHCGWNSTLESICSGVPMACWPFFADQQTNCWYCCTKWGVGMEIDVNLNVKRDMVERQVRELMGGEKGDNMRKKAMEWKKLAQEAIMSPSGSSYSNLESAIKVLLS